jgi:hypothetical protein
MPHSQLSSNGITAPEQGCQQQEDVSVFVVVHGVALRLAGGNML